MAATPPGRVKRHPVNKKKEELPCIGKPAKKRKALPVLFSQTRGALRDSFDLYNMKFPKRRNRKKGDDLCHAWKHMREP